MENAIVEKLIAMGGKEWKGGNNHRIYLSEVARATSYANEVAGWMRNNEMSGKNASRFKETVRTMYYDVNSGEYGCGLSSSYAADFVYFNKLVAEIKSKI